METLKKYYRQLFPVFYTFFSVYLTTVLIAANFSYKKKSAKERASTRWLIDMAGSNKENTKRQIVQLYDI